MARARSTRRFAFAAGHRYWVAAWTPQKNEQVFGRLTVPHGHNYTLEVTARGPIDAATGMAIDMVMMDQVVRSVLDNLDHKHLDREVHGFAARTSTGENIVIYLWEELARRFEGRLAHLKLWETNKNIFEYSDQESGV